MLWAQGGRRLHAKGRRHLACIRCALRWYGSVLGHRVNHYLGYGRSDSLGSGCLYSCPVPHSPQACIVVGDRYVQSARLKLHGVSLEQRDRSLRYAVPALIAAALPDCHHEGPQELQGNPRSSEWLAGCSTDFAVCSHCGTVAVWRGMCRLEGELVTHTHYRCSEHALREFSAQAASFHDQALIILNILIPLTCLSTQVLRR